MKPLTLSARIPRVPQRRESVERIYFVGGAGSEMTMSGALQKTFLMWAIALTCGIWGWRVLADWDGGLLPVFVLANVGAFGFAALTCFYRGGAILTGSLFAVFEGGIFGVIAVASDRWIEGMSVWLLGISCFALVITAGLYRLGLLRSKSAAVIAMITGIAAAGVCLLGGLIARGYGGNICDFWLKLAMKGGLGGLVGSGIAANLLLDLSAIKNGVDSGAPKHMEWYSAFSVLVSTLWLFVELFRIVAEMGGRVGRGLRGS